MMRGPDLELERDGLKQVVLGVGVYCLLCCSDAVDSLEKKKFPLKSCRYSVDYF